MSRIVITGAPGAGKSTLLLALQARGYTIVGDTARTIIQDRRRRGLSPRPDPYAFAQEALRIDMENSDFFSSLLEITGAGNHVLLVNHGT
jgi:predicted ATPase